MRPALALLLFALLIAPAAIVVAVAPVQVTRPAPDKRSWISSTSKLRLEVGPNSGKRMMQPVWKTGPCDAIYFTNPPQPMEGCR